MITIRIRRKSFIINKNSISNRTFFHAQQLPFSIKPPASSVQPPRAAEAALQAKEPNRHIPLLEFAATHSKHRSLVISNRHTFALLFREGFPSRDAARNFFPPLAYDFFLAAEVANRNSPELEFTLTPSSAIDASFLIATKLHFPAFASPGHFQKMEETSIPSASRISRTAKRPNPLPRDIHPAQDSPQMPGQHNQPRREKFQRQPVNRQSPLIPAPRTKMHPANNPQQHTRRAGQHQMLEQNPLQLVPAQRPLPSGDATRDHRHRKESRRQQIVISSSRHRAALGPLRNQVENESHQEKCNRKMNQHHMLRVLLEQRRFDIKRMHGNRSLSAIAPCRLIKSGFGPFTPCRQQRAPKYSAARPLSLHRRLFLKMVHTMSPTGASRPESARMKKR